MQPAQVHRRPGVQTVFCRDVKCRSWLHQQQAARRPACAALFTSARAARTWQSKRHSVVCQLQPERKAEAVCIGEGLFDLIADQKGVPREEVKSWTPYPGGAPCNVACGLGKLGVAVTFVSAIGEDDLGEQLMGVLRDSGVQLNAVQRVQQPTRGVYVVRDASGDRTFAGFGDDTRSYCDCFIDAKNIPRDAIQDARVLVTGTLGLAYPGTAAAMRAAVDAAKAGGCCVLVDVNWRPVFWTEGERAAHSVIVEYLQNADIVKISDDEVEWVVGVKAADALENPTLVHEKFPNASGVLVTAGSSGAAYCFKARHSSNGGGEMMSGFVPVFDVDVQETTGAGDAFTCGFIFKMLEAGGMQKLMQDGEQLRKAVVYGAASGALTTTGPGAIAAQPTAAAVKELLNRIGEGA